LLINFKLTTYHYFEYTKRVIHLFLKGGMHRADLKKAGLNARDVRVETGAVKKRQDANASTRRRRSRQTGNTGVL
jgi:hypothetical protein